IRHGSLPKPSEKLVYDAKVGSVVGPIQTYEGYSIFKILRDSATTDEYVSASHILINFGGDTTAALNKVKSIINELKSGADFATLAKQYSQDPGSGQNGGDLGWFGKGQMVPEFEKAAFGGKIGEIIGPIKTSYGFHIIKVHQKSKSIRIAAELSNPVKVSSQTREEIYNSANDFAYLLSKGNDFEKEAELMKYQVLETPSFNSKSEYVPGVGMNKALVDFAFENKLNTVSESYRIPGGYVVAKISDVVNEGVKKFDEVKESLKPLVLREKKMELMKKRAEEMRKKIPAGESLSYLTKLDSTLVVTNTGSFGYGQFVGGNVGRDFDFNFATFKLKQGEISNPVKGQRGYYLIQLVSKTDFDKNAYDMQKTSLRNQLLQEKKSMFFNQWLANLKKNAKIEDHRHKYYR
ncbi:MAG: peptidylprolyl isomerase, partial [Ignavibacteria bacterium]|nr:peptidylprolyl isomerase [Ignavibacteria bacterium]